MITGGTYFSGGEGVGVAMRAAGLSHSFGVEFDERIAGVARANGFHVLTADVRAVDPATLPRVDVFHASPVCKNASNAKADGEESPEDRETARAVCRYLEHHKPRVFTLENVWGYRTFEAFKEICATLTRLGYKWDYWHLNSADYGVPQTRKRLVLVASTEFQPAKPRETHTEKPVPLFETLAKWVGWYEAIEDLLPTLPESRFAKWQLERLPADLKTSLFANGAYGDGTVSASIDQLANAITANRNQNSLRAFLMQVQGAGGDGLRNEDEPMQTVTENHGANKYRAFLIGDQEGQISDRVARSNTVRGYGTGGAVPRALLPAGQRVVRMTPRALARFQSFPDSYILPVSNTLACTVIGNAVPPKLYAAVLDSFLERLK